MNKYKDMKPKQLVKLLEKKKDRELREIMITLLMKGINKEEGIMEVLEPLGEKLVELLALALKADFTSNLKLGPWDIVESFMYELYDKIADYPLEPIVKLLAHPDEHTYQAALVVFQKHGMEGKLKKEYAAEIHKVMKFYNDPQAKGFAAGILGNAKYKEAFLDIYDLAHIDEPENVRHTAIYVLGQLQDERAIPFLLEVLYDRKSNFRHSALRALEAFDDKSLINEIRNATNDNQERVRKKAEEILEKWGE